MINEVVKYCNTLSIKNEDFFIYFLFRGYLFFISWLFIFYRYICTIFCLCNHANKCLISIGLLLVELPSKNNIHPNSISPV